ncbi:MAG: DeoR/GlpR family DNA-binding transcription regulator [Capsulimonadales bacterium]|nr:DeoR/GlpR family DNA-binding transcription regulator [Capsulimonadales bacterium]
MFVEERQQRILERLRQQGKVTVEELVGTFGVSAPTVRADLAALESRHLLRRTHGGALPAVGSLYEPPYAERAVDRAEEKRRIGQAAAELVRSGETVLLDAGTTAHEVGIALLASGKDGITVVTNNLPTVLTLMDAPGLTVICIGGTVQARRRAALGPLSVEFLRPFRADWLFVGVNGIDADAGLTVSDFEVAQTKRAMLAAAATPVVVADSGKVGHVAFAHVVPVSAIPLLITDRHLPTEAETGLRDAGIAEIRRA